MDFFKMPSINCYMISKETFSLESNEKLRNPDISRDKNTERVNAGKRHGTATN